MATQDQDQDQDQPPQPVFQWELCAELHNRILDLGWAVVTAETGWEPHEESWWEHQFGCDDDDDDESMEEKTDPDEEGQKELVDDKPKDADSDNEALAEELQRRLHPDVVKFLKTARYDNPGAEDSSHFFYYLKELMSPRRMITALDNETFGTHLTILEPHPDRYVCLYIFPDTCDEFLMLNQQTMKVAMLYERYEFFEFDPNVKWVPLEVILTAFIDMIERGRVVAASVWEDYENPEDEPKDRQWPEDGESGKFWTPWMLSENDEKLVDVTITAWNGLLSAIESRIPGFPEIEPKNYSEEQIKACDFHGYFIEDFVRKARIPNFRFVAPGLRLALPEELTRQPFLDFIPNTKRYGFKWYPFLFLLADRKIPRPHLQDRPFLEESNSFFEGSPWQQAAEFSTGLYLHSVTKTIARADGCRLLLPFPINSNGFAKLGDGTVIEDRRKYDWLYQPGKMLIFREDDNLRLELLFKNWTSMIENGHWEVDENGVRGGIEKFKDADTEDKWNLYCIDNIG